MNKSKCEECGKEYEKRVFWQKFCCEKCKLIAWANRKEATARKSQIIPTKRRVE